MAHFSNPTFEEFLQAFRAACELDSSLSLEEIRESWANREMTAKELAEASDQMVRGEPPEPGSECRQS